MAGNAVQYVRAVSQNGGNFVFTNPWPGQNVEVYRNGTDTGTVSGTKITIATSANDTLDLAPAGTSLATINTELAQPTADRYRRHKQLVQHRLRVGQPGSRSWTDTVDTTGGGLVSVDRTLLRPHRTGIRCAHRVRRPTPARHRSCTPDRRRVAARTRT